MEEEVELAWAAGFFDGEGNVQYFHRENPTGSVTKQLRLRIAQVNREPLDRIQRILGGKVYGPYQPRNERANPYYEWASTSRLATVEIARSLMPYLCSIKRVQMELALADLV